MIAAHEQGDSGFLEPPFSASKETLKSGSRIGQSEVLAEIGAGGMGEVYRARDAKLGREVAIKILPAAFAHDPERLARFQREAEFLASLNHPNIASIYGLEDSGNTRALIMELVEGATLADRIKTGPMPIEEALPIAKQICEALEYAHERGVVHRDLKPANIKMSSDDSVKILDFWSRQGSPRRSQRIERRRFAYPERNGNPGGSSAWDVGVHVARTGQEQTSGPSC